MINISGPTRGKYSASRSIVCKDTTWGRVRPVGFVCVYSAMSMRHHPVLPEVADSVHLLLGEAAMDLPQGQTLKITDAIRVFQHKEAEIRNNTDNQRKLARLIDQKLILPSTSHHNRTAAN